MKKFLIIPALVAGFVFAGNAMACSDLNYTSDMSKPNKTAYAAITMAGKGSYSTGLRYLRLAQAQHNSVRQPCAPALKAVDYQYTLALNYFEDGLMYLMRGNYSAASTSLKTGSRWLSRATASLHQYHP